MYNVFQFVERFQRFNMGDCLVIGDKPHLVVRLPHFKREDASFDWNGQEEDDELDFCEEYGPDNWVFRKDKWIVGYTLFREYLDANGVTCFGTIETKFFNTNFQLYDEKVHSHLKDQKRRLELKLELDSLS
jgi:hypothetical protein